MKLFFDSLVARYATSTKLRHTGRKLVRPATITPRNTVKPFVTVEGRMIGKLDTFDSDLETWELEFVYNGKSLRVADADDWLEAMVETFEHANILGGLFTTVGMNMTGREEPTRDGDTFTASVTFELTVQRRTRSPLTRAI